MHLNRDWTMQECSRKASVVPMWVVPLCPTGVVPMWMVPMCGPIVSHGCGPNVWSHCVPQVWSQCGWSHCVVPLCPTGVVPMVGTVHGRGQGI